MGRQTALRTSLKDSTRLERKITREKRLPNNKGQKRRKVG